MAKRIITAAILIPIALVLILMNNSWVMLTTMAVISAVATYEILVATKYLSNFMISAVSIIFSLTIPFAFSIDAVRSKVPVITFGFLVVLFVVMIFMHEQVKFEEVAVMAFVSICIPLALSSIAFMQATFPIHGTFYVIFTLISVWIGDGGAYFIGTFFGKHKMAPKISPKKSWEGFIGGIVTSGIFGVLLGCGYQFLGNNGLIAGEYFVVNVPYLVVLALICSVLGVVGDFSASIVKRQCSVKDFGNIIPGHGGILDRFDSVLFAAPLVYLMFKIAEPITIIV